MALVSVNGQDVVEISVSMPRSGAWTADLLVDEPTAITGAVQIAINVGTPDSSPVMVLSGTVGRTGEFLDANHLRVVAGADGLGKAAKPRHYQGPSVRTVLGDLLADAGERLSSMADASILATGLDAWSSTAVPVGTLISMLLATAAPGASWRMLPDGTLWVGRETWPDAGVDSSTYQIFEDSAETNTMLIGVDAPFLLPGTTFEGRRVSRVDHRVGQVGQGVETLVWFEDAAPSERDRLKDAIAKLVRATPVGLDYRGRYWATIISQSDGETIPPNLVDVQLEQLPGQTQALDMAGVPLLVGIPGAQVKSTRGGRVLVGWAGADPSKPYAEAFDVENVASEVTIVVRSGLFLGGQTGALALVTAPILEALTTLAEGVNAYAVAIQLIADPTNTVTPTLTAAIQAFTGAIATMQTTLTRAL